MLAIMCGIRASLDSGRRAQIGCRHSIDVIDLIDLVELAMDPIDLT
jgi:hypothetical protein